MSTAVIHLPKLAQESASAAEELASTAEEMNGQAKQLEDWMSFQMGRVSPDPLFLLKG